jgi:valyl-tRNA synthetase
MDATGHINAEGGAYAGLDRYKARKKIVVDLEEQGLLASVKDYTNNVGHCDRCKTVVEPRLSTQWFVAVNKKATDRGASMAELAIAAVKPGPDGEKAIRFTPEQYEKTYLNWMENIHDWCISRQLWWGHRIPAWHCSACHKITVARVDPTACAHCGSDQITQETDVLDTWFSSGLLPVSVFGWPNFTRPNLPQILGAPSFPCTSAERMGRHDSPSAGAPGPSHLGTWESRENRADFDAFYPTSLLVTGFDILFFWVARMIMFGCWFAADVPMPDGSPRPLAESVPFREVYIHALVRDANREKMSKTKGNVLDPIEIVKQYGTDAVRFTLASMASPGTDIAFNVARTEGYRAFANKIWNAARFLFMNVDRAAEIGITVDLSALGEMPVAAADAPLEARWIVEEFNLTTAEVNLSLTNYRYDDAANAIYRFFWEYFCDWYLEGSKLRLDIAENTGTEYLKNALPVFVSVFEASLRLLSPFMPFLTEEIWQKVYDDKPPVKSIALLKTYPKFGEDKNLPQIRMEHAYKEAVRKMAAVRGVVTAIRALRKEKGVPDKETVSAHVYCSGQVGTMYTDLGYQEIQLCEHFARVHLSRSIGNPPSAVKVHSKPAFDVSVDYEAPERTIDVPAERERLGKDIAKYEKGLAAAERQLGNEGFLAKAPSHVVEGLKKLEAETRLLLEKARSALDALPNS